MWKRRRKASPQDTPLREKAAETQQEKSDLKKAAFSGRLEKNIGLLRKRLDYCADIVYREISLNGKKACLVYDMDMIDQGALNESILKGCFDETRMSSIQGVEEALAKLFEGQALFLRDGSNEALLLDIKRLETRGIEAPVTEPGILGPKDSFGEALSVNASLLRRRLPLSDFKMIELVLGRLTKTKIRVCYLESVAGPRLVAEVLRRLKIIDTDGILSEGILEELIEDEPYSVFPTILTTERPDRTVASILEGRVAIIQDNSSFALIMPAAVMQFFQAADDYYNRYYFSSFIRFTRVAALFLSVYLPGIYVAVTTFHQEMLPTPLLISIQTQREGIPYPAIVEALMMGFAFEILREAGLRLPRAIGPAISIVGALIIGESAVMAGLVSPAMVIVTAVTAIASFTFPAPTLVQPALLIRIVIVINSSILGLWGILVTTLVVSGHLVSLRSFGVPYMLPIGPLVLEDLDDFLVRAPAWSMRTRPLFLSRRNPIRQRRGIV